jgi:hypothetical protein
MSFSMSLHHPNIQIEFLMSNIEIPNKFFLFKEKLSRYGIDISVLDKLYVIDSDNDKIELEEHNFDSISNDNNNCSYSFNSRITKYIKFILIKYERPSDPLLINFKDMNKNFGIAYSSINQLHNKSDDSDMNKIIEGLNNFDNFNCHNKFLANLSNISNFENLSLQESIILSPIESCFQYVYKKYINDFLSILNNWELKESNHNSSNTKSKKNLENLNKVENEIQNFYDYFKFKNQDIKAFIETLKELFTTEEINQAKEAMTLFHNLIITLNEFKNITINDLIKAIKKNYEKLKVCEYTIIEQRIKLKSLQENMEMNKGYFNKFMIELQEIFDEEFNFDFNNNNFEFDNFDENLSNVFSFLIKTAMTLNSINGKPLIKSQKYVNIESTNHNVSLNNNCLKHNYCFEKACLYKAKHLDEKFIYENNYKNDLLYDV